MTDRSFPEAAERGREIAERHVMRLREAGDRRLEEQQTLWWQNKRLRQRIMELEAQIEGMAK